MKFLVPILDLSALTDKHNIKAAKAIEAATRKTKCRRAKRT